jgi:DNA-binding NarL/FixJ family response regulator
VVSLTITANDQHVHETLIRGADGYVLKDSTREDLITAIRVIWRVETYLSESGSKFRLMFLLRNISSRGT